MPVGSFPFLPLPFEDSSMSGLVPLLLFGGLVSGADPGEIRRPNVVIILADDLGWGDVGFHASKNKTPNLDRLAKQGVELRQQYVNPVCSPTRTALMTGRYPSRFGVTNPQNELAIPLDTLTLPRALKAAGYETAITGKWHLGSRLDWGPQVFGFDHSYGSLAGGCGPFDHRYKTGPFTQTWHRNGKLIEEKGHITDLLTREAVQWLEGRKDRSKPFFLYVPLTAVHIPIEEPQKYLDLYPDIAEPSRRHYAACVSHLDESVGRIVETLEKIGATRDTLVVFFSDNGAYPMAKNDDRQYPNGDKYTPGPAGGSNLPLRGQKTQLYEGGIRVPCLAYWPGRLKPGTCEQVLHAADWMPSLVNLCGAKVQGDRKWDGKDVWPMIAGNNPVEPRQHYWAGVGFRTSAVRDGNWKLIHTKAAKDKKESYELFDLGSDPNETTDLADKRPMELIRLRKLLETMAAADNTSKPPRE